MSGPCTDCGGPDYQTLEAKNVIAAEDLEAAKRDLQVEREWRGKAEAIVGELEGRNTQLRVALDDISEILEGVFA